MTILAFIFGIVVTFFVLGVVTHRKDTQPKNKVHFYVVRFKDKTLCLYLGKPIRDEVSKSFLSDKCGGLITNWCKFKSLGLNIDDYKDLKWEDEPVEVFLNLDD